MTYNFSQALRGHLIHGHLYINKWCFKECFQRYRKAHSSGSLKKGRHISTPIADELNEMGVRQRKPSPLRLQTITVTHKPYVSLRYEKVESWRRK